MSQWIESAALDDICDTDLVLRLCGIAGGVAAHLRYSVLLQFSEKKRHESPQLIFHKRQKMVFFSYFSVI